MCERSSVRCTGSPKSALFHKVCTCLEICSYYHRQKATFKILESKAKAVLFIADFVFIVLLCLSIHTKVVYG